MFSLDRFPGGEDRIFSNIKRSNHINDNVSLYSKILSRETGNTDFLKIHFHTFRHYAISWHYFKSKDLVETQRFARHCNVMNTLKYIHVVTSWIKEGEYDVVFTQDKAEFSKFLSEGYTLIEKTEWGYCLRKPKLFVKIN